MKRTVLNFRIEELHFDHVSFIYLLMQNTSYSPSTVTVKSNTTDNGKLVSEYQIGKVKFEVRIQGELHVMDPHGKVIKDINELYSYYKKKESDRLLYEKIPVLKLIEKNNEQKYHGVFYSLADAEHYLKNNIEAEGDFENEYVEKGIKNLFSSKK